MIPAVELSLFAGIVLGVVLLPGLDMAFVLGCALAGGRARGLAAVLGIVAGGLCHVAIGATGTAVVLRLFPAAGAAMLLAGAAFMAWVGLSIARSAAPGGPTVAPQLASRRATFRRGALTNLLNPKAYAFMLAIFPQFVRPARGPVALQALELAAVIATIQIAVYGALAVAADGARGWLGRHPRTQVALVRAVGLLLVAAAAWSAIEGVRRVAG